MNGYVAERVFLPYAVRTALVIALLTMLAPVLAVVGPGERALAHDDIEGSVPADRSVIDEPISTAEIDFGETIGEGVELFLTYEPGDGETVDIGGETTKTGAETARLDFPELTQQGTYFLRFLAPVPADGHVIFGSVSFTWGAATAVDEGDNADIRSSSPTSRDRIDEPITSAEIEFDLEIADDVSLALVYDRGDGENFDDLGGTTTKTGPRTAVVEFDQLPRQGTYFVTYDAVAELTGDEVVGAIQFTWGDPSGTGDSFPLLAFTLAAAAILAVGAVLSIRRMKSPTADDSTADEPVTV